MLTTCPKKFHRKRLKVRLSREPAIFFIGLQSGNGDDLDQA